MRSTKNKIRDQRNNYAVREGKELLTNKKERFVQLYGYAGR